MLQRISDDLSSTRNLIYDEGTIFAKLCTQDITGKIKYR